MRVVSYLSQKILAVVLFLVLECIAVFLLGALLFPSLVPTTLDLGNEPLISKLPFLVIGLPFGFWLFAEGINTLLCTFRYELLADDTGVTQIIGLSRQFACWDDVDSYFLQRTEYSGLLQQPTDSEHRVFEPVLKSRDDRVLLRPILHVAISSPRDERDEFWSFVTYRIDYHRFSRPEEAMRLKNMLSSPCSRSRGSTL